jgi:hypothetical protein
MTTQTTVVKESKPGNWSIYWELRGIPARADTQTVRANETFTCGEKIYKVDLMLFGNAWVDGCYLLLDFETTEGNE